MLCIRLEMDLLPESSLCLIGLSVFFVTGRKISARLKEEKSDVPQEPVNGTHNIGFWADELGANAMGGDSSF